MAGNALQPILVLSVQKNSSSFHASVMCDLKIWLEEHVLHLSAVQELLLGLKDEFFVKICENQK